MGSIGGIMLYAMPRITAATAVATSINIRINETRANITMGIMTK